jgi:hypothetical protein
VIGALIATPSSDNNFLAHMQRGVTNKPAVWGGGSRRKEGRVNLNVRIEFQKAFNRTTLSSPDAYQSYRSEVHNEYVLERSAVPTRDSGGGGLLAHCRAESVLRAIGSC